MQTHVFEQSGFSLFCLCGRLEKSDAHIHLTEQPVTKPSNPKDAIGVTKPPSSTVSQTVMAEIGLAMLEGALKYGRHNYRVIGVRSSVYYDATRRHIDKWWEGQDIDPDSGLSHITKAIASLVVLRDSMIQDMLNDDRPPCAPPGVWAELEAKTKEILSRFPDPVPAYTEKSEAEKEKQGATYLAKSNIAPGLDAFPL